MPRRKKYYGRRGSRKKPSAMTIAKKALRQNRPRMKYSLTSFSATTMINIWTTFLLNGISQGDDETDRDGDKIKMHALEVRLLFESAASEQNGAVIRYCVVYDRQPNGFIASGVDVMEDSRVTSVRNITRTARFRVLLDRTMRLENYTGNSAVSQHFVRTHYLRWKSPMRTQYNGATSAIGEINTGSIFFMFISDRSGDFPTVATDFKLSFTSS